MIVADSSAIISLAINCMSSALGELNASIVVTPSVYNEVITQPLTTKRFALEAMRIGKLFDKKIISVKEVDRKAANEILDAVNSVFEVRGRPLNIIHRGEADAVTLARDVKADALLIDERTTRLLIEDIQEVKNTLSFRTGKKIEVNRKKFDELGRMLPQIPVIRSAEIAAIAYEKGVLDKQLEAGRGNPLDAALCALKFSGCSISWEEIEEYTRLIR